MNFVDFNYRKHKELTILGLAGVLTVGITSPRGWDSDLLSLRVPLYPGEYENSNPWTIDINQEVDVYIIFGMTAWV